MLNDNKIIPQELPPEGTKVKAITLPSYEYESESREIEGILFTNPTPLSKTPNCYVDGISVDPKSVKASEE